MADFHEQPIRREYLTELKKIEPVLMPVGKEIWELDHEPPKSSVVHQRPEHPVNRVDIARRCFEGVRKSAEEFDGKQKVFILGDVIHPSVRMHRAKRSVIKR